MTRFNAEGGAVIKKILDYDTHSVHRGLQQLRHLKHKIIFLPRVF